MNLDNNKIAILQFINSNEVVSISQIEKQFDYDIDYKELGNILNYLFAKKLIIKASEPNYNSYILTDSAKEILYNIDRKREIDTKKSIQREELEIENLRLQNETINYQTSIRDKQEEINQLSIENLKLQNRGLKRAIIFLILGFLFGFITSNWQWILTKLR